MRWVKVISVGAAILAVIAVVVLIVAVAGEREPRVTRSGDSAVPRVAFFRKFDTGGGIYFIGWSADGASITVLSGYGKWLSVYDLHGNIKTRTALPVPYTAHFVLNPHQIVMAGNTRTRVAFNIIDLATNRVSFSQALPAGLDSGISQAEVHFGLSADGSTLAVGYGGLVSHEPITLYDTNTWSQKLAIAPDPAIRPGVGDLVFSPDGRLLAFGTAAGLDIVETRSGKPVRTFSDIPGFASRYAFSPDGDMIALRSNTPSEINLAVLKSSGVKVVRLADGALLASHPPPPVLPDCKDVAEDCGIGGRIFWDPRGRFIASGEGEGGGLQLWNPFRRPAESVEIDRVFGPAALSPNGEWLAVGGIDDIVLFRIGDDS